MTRFLRTLARRYLFRPTLADKQARIRRELEEYRAVDRACYRAVRKALS